MDTRPGQDAPRFVQVLEAPGGIVCRVWASDWEGVDLQALELRADGRAVPATARLWDGRVLSLVATLARAPRRLELRHRGRRLARLLPEGLERLVLERDLRMVNPSIDGAFGQWCAAHGWAETTEPACDPDELGARPLMSLVVPLWRTPLPYLDAMARSVLAQTYPRWELVLVNASPEDAALARAVAGLAASDARVRVVDLPQNLGIAANTNAGIRAATGDYVGFLDHDDLLAPRALEAYARVVAERPEVDLLFCDEDSFREDLGDRSAPVLKPRLNLDLLYSHNYVEHLLMVSRWALARVEPSPDDVSGAQDHDLTLKVAEVARDVAHVPEVLYHWRAHPGSTNGGIMEGKPYAIAASERAVARHLARRGADVCSVAQTSISCVFRTTYGAGEKGVSALVTYADEGRLRNLVAGLVAQAGARPLQVVAVGPRPADEGALREAAAGAALELVAWEGAPDRAAMVDAALPRARHGLVLLCADTVSLDHEGCLDQLAGCLSRDDVGVVAPKLLYPDGLVQHAGVGVLPDGGLVLLNQDFSAHMGGGYLGLAECSCAYGAVGPDCLMLRRDDLVAAGGLDARLGNALLAAVGLCLWLRAAGKACVVLPDALATNAAPVVWEARDALGAYGRTDTLGALWQAWPDPEWRRDVLWHPCLTMENGYLQLDVGRDVHEEAERIIAERRAHEDPRAKLRRLLGR